MANATREVIITGTLPASDPRRRPGSKGRVRRFLEVPATLTQSAVETYVDSVLQAEGTANIENRTLEFKPSFENGGGE